MILFKHLELPDEGLALIVARPGAGKTYVAVEMANELTQYGIKTALVYTVGGHDVIGYDENGVHTIPSRLSCIRAHFPEIPYVIKDGGDYMTPYGWQKFLTAYIANERPQVLFINQIVPPCIKASAELLSALQKIGKENHVLIVAEVQATRRVERRSDKHPRPRDAKCATFARKYVDCFAFLYSDYHYSIDGPCPKIIEVYTSKENKILLPYDCESLYRQ